MVLDGTATKSVEFVEEDEFGVFPTDPTMLGLGGYVHPASIKKTPVVENFPYLKSPDSDNRLQSMKTVKVSEAYEVELTYKPIDWSFLPYVLGADDPSTFSIGDNKYGIALGVVVGSEYEKLLGGCISSFECTVEEEKTAECKVKMLFAGTSGVESSDYVGAGSHASDPTGDPLVWEDITGVQVDAADLSTLNASMESLKFGIEYDAKPVKDIGSTFASNIGGWSYGQRNIYSELGVSLDALDLSAEVLDGADHTMSFTALSKTLTFSKMKFESDFEEELAADDVLGTTLKASYVDLAIE